MNYLSKILVLAVVCFSLTGCGESEKEKKHRENVALLAKIARQEEAARKENFVVKNLIHESSRRFNKGLKDMTPEEHVAFKKKLEAEFDKTNK